VRIESGEKGGNAGNRQHPPTKVLDAVTNPYVRSPGRPRRLLA